MSIVKIKPFYYCHILNKDTNVTTLRVGPDTYVRKDCEELVTGPTPMIQLARNTYITIKNPVRLDTKGQPIVDDNGVVTLVDGDFEYRSADDYPNPLPLYPGEELVGKATPLQVLNREEALLLEAEREVEGHHVGEQWLFTGSTYKPRREVKVVKTITATIIGPNQALMVECVLPFTDSSGKERVVGEQYLIKRDGAYIPPVEEKVLQTINAVTLTPLTALHLRAKDNFVDVYGRKRRHGDEWLVTVDNDTATDGDGTHLPDVKEEIVGTKDIIILGRCQYCFIIGAADKDGIPQLGKRTRKVGECSFFLQPHEKLQAGVQDAHILKQDEGLLIQALEAFTDPEGVERVAGEQWMVFGPRDFIPTEEMHIVETRPPITLNENEGIYVINHRTGDVRKEMGPQCYRLRANEGLYTKVLPDAQKELLRNYGFECSDPYRVITLRPPHHTATQIFNFQNSEITQSRVVYGPRLIVLDPFEQFGVLVLSGGKPKKANALRDLPLHLGPEFSTDVLEVDTQDHARLSLQLSYNWQFDVPEDPSAFKGFVVKDFLGDMCKAIASRVRSVVATKKFEDFHQNSAVIIREGVFGVNADGTPKTELLFPKNGLIVTSVDVQESTPTDPKTKELLQKSVTQAIEITTRNQEQKARHETDASEQQSRNKLLKQMLEDQTRREVERKGLLELEASSRAIETVGQATSEAAARAEAAIIEARSEADLADQRAKTEKLVAAAELKKIQASMDLEFEKATELRKVEVARAKKLAEVEIAAFRRKVEAIGVDTIKKIALAAPEAQIELLKGLNVQNYIVTDAANGPPINIFQGAGAQAALPR